MQSNTYQHDFSRPRQYALRTRCMGDLEAAEPGSRMKSASSAQVGVGIKMASMYRLVNRVGDSG